MTLFWLIMAAIYLAGFMDNGLCSESAWTADHSAEIPKYIRAIKQAENWDGHSVGAAGERGPMQFLPDVWAAITLRPFYMAERRNAAACVVADYVERKHIERLIHFCDYLHRPATAYSIGLLHNAGFAHVRDHTASAAKKDFAQRVQNLYDSP